MGDAVVEFDGPTQVYRSEVQGVGLFAVAGVVDGEGALPTLPLLDVLHEEVALALFVRHVGLQVERVLVQGDEVLVAEQLQGFRFQLRHIAADEQR